jgi:short-subunit dehydrogenase
VTLLVNNAGYHANTRLVVTPQPDAARREMEVNYFGTLEMTRAFAPILGANGGGAIVNVLSVAAVVPAAFMGGYSPSKAAMVGVGLTALTMYWRMKSSRLVVTEAAPIVPVKLLPLMPSAGSGMILEYNS